VRRADARFLEHGLQRDACPARVSHAPFESCPPFTRGEKWPRPFPEQLIDRDEIRRGGQPLQRFEGELERTLDTPADAQPEGRRIDGEGKAAPVVSHEERVVRRQQPLVEDSEGCFQLRGRLVSTISGRFCGYATSWRPPFSNGSTIVSCAGGQRRAREHGGRAGGAGMRKKTCGASRCVRGVAIVPCANPNPRA
jgi:hypothetical protein